MPPLSSPASPPALAPDSPLAPGVTPVPPVPPPVPPVPPVPPALPPVPPVPPALPPVPPVPPALPPVPPVPPAPPPVPPVPPVPTTVHTPLWHWPLVHGVPLGAFGFVQVPPDRHEPATWQASLAEQVFGEPGSQLPPEQTSPSVQASPSLHEAVLFV